MKVMLVNECPVGLAGSGGAEKHVEQLLDALSEQGHTPVLVTSQLNGDPEVRLPGRYAIPHLTAPPLRKKVFGNLRNHARALQRAKEIVLAEDPDVIHIHNLMHPRTLRLFRSLRPTVKSIHDCRPFCSKPYPVVASRLVGDSETMCTRRFGLGCWTRCYARAGKRPIERLEAWSYFPFNFRALREIMACDRLVVYSNYIRRLATSNGMTDSKIDLLYLFTETRRPTSIRKDDPPLILFAGRISPEKGLSHLLAAVKQLPAGLNFRLVIAGDGPLRMELEEHSKSLNLQHPIEWPGFLPHDVLLNLYQRAAFVVLPSIGVEGCGLTGIEAMHCATPVVGFKVGGVGEWLVDQQTGLSVPRGDVAALKDAMEYMLRNPQERQLMGDKAQAFVQAKFRRDTHINNLIVSYRQAVQARSSTASKGSS
jgi:glycosyltransferase involved in cell wall biosynthesis